VFLKSEVTIIALKERVSTKYLFVRHQRRKVAGDDSEMKERGNERVGEW
jgi:hypothetical protein